MRALEAAALEATGLVVSFRGVKALDGMSLVVPEGRITGLIGANGAGKSSLFDVLSGVRRPDAGTVRLAGRDVTGRPPTCLAELRMTRTSQFSRELARATVLEDRMVSHRGQLGERPAASFLRPGAVRRAGRDLYARAVDVLERIALAELADS
jgi:ABC-type branched-subunit amino acid transport system ATPase component